MYSYSDISNAKQSVLESIAERLGKPVRELVGWADYDPIMVEEDALRRLSRGVRFAGD